MTGKLDDISQAIGALQTEARIGAEERRLMRASMEAEARENAAFRDEMRRALACLPALVSDQERLETRVARIEKADAAAKNRRIGFAAGMTIGSGALGAALMRAMEWFNAK